MKLLMYFLHLFLEQIKASDQTTLNEILLFFLWQDLTNKLTFYWDIIQVNIVKIVVNDAAYI